MTGPLSGFRILDFCWIGAGALVTKGLAELGAEVIRVESRTHPDNLRLTPPFRPGTEGLEASGYFASRNPDKKSFALNMSHPEAGEIVRELVAKVDMVTSNFRPGVMEKWGLSYEEVRAINPEVIYLVMPMQGLDGPHRSFVGFGSTISALSGLVHLTGEPGRVPVGTGTHYPDHVPNPGHSLVASLAAIYQRERTGQGQQVELSQLESTINVIGPALLAASAGSDPGAVGNRIPGVVPRGVYRTRDGSWMVVACWDDEHWAALLAELTAAGMDGALEPMGGAEREQHRHPIDEAVSRWVGTLDLDAAMTRLEAAGIPHGPVNTSAGVLADPRLEERGFWKVIDHPVIGEMPMFRLPFVRRPGGRGEMSPPPLLGEHTWEVASTLLGMERDRYEHLVAEQVLY